MTKGVIIYMTQLVFTGVRTFVRHHILLCSTFSLSPIMLESSEVAIHEQFMPFIWKHTRINGNTIKVTMTRFTADYTIYQTLKLITSIQYNAH